VSSLGSCPCFTCLCGQCHSLVKAAEKAFGTLPVSPNPNPLGPKAHTKPDFIGSEVRSRDDNIPMTHIAVAIEDIGCPHPTIISGARHAVHFCALGSASLLSSCLSDIIAKHSLANSESYMSFLTSYSDTGLWRILPLYIGELVEIFHI
jgi:mitochondrial-processing peptidase subunit beta